MLSRLSLHELGVGGQRWSRALGSRTTAAALMKVRKHAVTARETTPRSAAVALTKARKHVTMVRETTAAWTGPAMVAPSGHPSHAPTSFPTELNRHRP
jgi:CO/xanthine dehydrogenase Mo-binding subunit